MPTLTLLLMMQLVVSTKAGLVNHVQGLTNLNGKDMVQAGEPMLTGRNGFTEVLLTPGAFLRLDENSGAVLDNVDLSNVAVRILSGTGLIEVIDIDKAYPIRVTTGNLSVEIFQPGIFQFTDGVATVLQGKLQTADSRIPYTKGWQVFFKDAYRARKVGEFQTTGLDVFSMTRSNLIARANASVVPNLSRTGVYGGSNGIWMFSAGYGLFTYIPRDRFRSPYGAWYYGYTSGVDVANGGGSTASNGGSTGGNNNPTNPPPGNSNGGGSTGGFPSGGTFSTPAGAQSSPGDYIGGKSAPAPATIP